MSHYIISIIFVILIFLTWILLLKKIEWKLGMYFSFISFFISCLLDFPFQGLWFIWFHLLSGWIILLFLKVNQLQIDVLIKYTIFWSLFSIISYLLSLSVETYMIRFSICYLLWELNLFLANNKINEKGNFNELIKFISILTLLIISIYNIDHSTNECGNTPPKNLYYSDYKSNKPHYSNDEEWLKKHKELGEKIDNTPLEVNQHTENSFKNAVAGSPVSMMESGIINSLGNKQYGSQILGVDVITTQTLEESIRYHATNEFSEGVSSSIIGENKTIAQNLKREIRSNWEKDNLNTKNFYRAHNRLLNQIRFYNWEEIEQRNLALEKVKGPLNLKKNI